MLFTSYLLAALPVLSAVSAAAIKTTAKSFSIQTKSASGQLFGGLWLLSAQTSDGGNVAVLEPQSFAGTQKFYLNGTSLATKSSTTSSTLVMYPDVASNEAWVPLNLDGGDSSDGFFSVVNNTLQFRFKKNQKQSSPWMACNWALSRPQLFVKTVAASLTPSNCADVTLLVNYQ